jgi:hypothetical protein
VKGALPSGTGWPKICAFSLKVHFPVNGVDEMVPTASTPGSADRRA